ncbi:MAG TPA: DUF559 domain-containing protein [Acidimicrobiales bacterium]|nr:DUF559 domain-containing protein [Acidimicrobiales bacterium]
MTPDQVDWAVRSGEWNRVYRGVYIVGPVDPSWTMAAHAVLLACGPFATLSHETGACVWDFRGATRGLITVTTPPGGIRALPGVHIRHSNYLPDAHIRTEKGLRVTSPIRTLFDYARAASEAQLESAIHDARFRSLIRPGDLTRILEEMGGRGRRGSALLRSVAEKMGENSAPAESELEVRFIRDVLRAHELPSPEAQYRVDVGARTYRIDFAYVRELLAIELDGRRWHGSPGDRRRDSVRDAELRLLGWEILRFDWEDVTRRPHRVAQQILAALADRTNKCMEPV